MLYFYERFDLVTVGINRRDENVILKLVQSSG